MDGWAHAVLRILHDRIVSIMPAGEVDIAHVEAALLAPRIAGQVAELLAALPAQVAAYRALDLLMADDELGRMCKGHAHLAASRMPQ